MCVAALPLAMMAASTAMSAYGQYQQGQVSSQIARNNATTANYAAQSAQQQGEIQAQQAQRQAAVVGGATRARLAANGVDLGVGTAGALQAQNDYFGEFNANAARYNASLNSWQNRAQAQNFMNEASADQYNAKLGAFSTVLGGGAQVAGKWYSYTNPGPGYPVGPQAGP